MPATPALDAFDLAILGILQRDNTTPQRAIAQAVHLSAPAVQRRIQRLQQNGVIRANVAVIDPEKVGLPLTIMVEVHLENERPDRTAPLRSRIAAEAAVQQCYSVTGEADYLLVVTVASMADYEALTRRLFEGDDNVRRFRT
jgi:Lrp/AsnC family transcriptional regulator, leucine-responsive regulatory protein